MNISRESSIFTEKKPPYPTEVREAWTDILISCWREGDNAYIDELRSNPLSKLRGIAKIDESEGKYFPLPNQPPNGVPNPVDSPEDEAKLRNILKENYKHFGQMMMGGGWTENDGEAWVDIIIRAWKDPDFLMRLRANPRETLESDYPRISESLGKFFPISKERPEKLQGCSEDELKRRLNEDEPGYMGWMMACCR